MASVEHSVLMEVQWQGNTPHSDSSCHPLEHHSDGLHLPQTLRRTKSEDQTHHCTHHGGDSHRNVKCNHCGAQG
eukprot:863940-Amphidinium_carterae.1